MRKGRLLLVLTLIVGLALILYPAFQPESTGGLINWGLAATILVILVVTALFFEFAESNISSKEIALVAMLGTLSAVLRIPFAALPGVQPCTFIIICTGYVFGPVAGFMVGALTALVSNLFLGQGPWTPYQMLAWGLLGAAAAVFRRFSLGKLWLIILGIAAGYIYGWIINTWYWASFIYPLTFRTYLTYQFTSIWFDTFHAVGNAVFLGLFGMKTIAILERFRLRFYWTIGINTRKTGLADAPESAGN